MKKYYSRIDKAQKDLVQTSSDKFYIQSKEYLKYQYILFLNQTYFQKMIQPNPTFEEMEAKLENFIKSIPIPKENENIQK